MKFVYCSDHHVVLSASEKVCNCGLGLHADQTDEMVRISLAGRSVVDIIDHWLIIDHFAQMVDILDFLVDVVSKWSIFHQNLSEWIL